MDLSCHNASVVNPLLGTRALTASAITVAQGDWVTEAEDAASSSILYENNVLVRFHDTFTTPFAPTYVEVHGTAGSLHAADVMTPEPSGRSFCTIAGDRTRSMSKTPAHVRHHAGTLHPCHAR